MYSKSQLAARYIRYWLHASNGKGHGVHSPFVFEFIEKVLNNKKDHDAYTAIEALRHSLKQDSRMLAIEDFGAGSRVDDHHQRAVRAIARSALKPAKFGQLLFRMVQYYRPSVILELGTSLGITTAYLASGNPDGRVITMEGAKAVAAIAKENFNRLSLTNISLVEGNFDTTLPELLSNTPTIDLAFIDGNHRCQPTVNYFKQILARANTGSIIILDDIHWSSEMEQAWQEVQQHPQVSMTIDLFFIGIVLLKEAFKVKQHFTIRY